MIQNFKLGELFEIQLGKTPARGNKNMWDQNKKSNNIWLSIKDLNQADANGYVSDSDEYISDDGAKLVKLIPKDTLLLSFKLTLGRTAITKIPLRTNEAIAALLPKTDQCNIRYLKYYFEYFDFIKFASNDFKVKGLTLNKKKLADIPIPVPSLREQEKIVERLDDIFSSISESIQIYDSKLENISKLKQSYIDEIFFNYENTADEVVLDDVSTIVGRIGYRGYTKKDLVSEGSGALSLSPSNIKNDEMTYIKNTFISWEKYEESPEIKIHDGDIIFCKTGSTYGKVAIVKDLKYKATLNPQLVVLKNLNIDNEFLFYQLLTSKFKNFIESIVGGTATPTLSQTNLGRAKVLNLNKKIQKDLTIKINTFLKKRKLLENNYIQMINLLKELKTSILIKEFNYE